MLPVWGLDCALIASKSHGKGPVAGGGAAPPREGWLQLRLAPRRLSGRCTCSHPSLRKERGWGGVHGLGWLPWSRCKRSVGNARLFLVSGRKGGKWLCLSLPQGCS